MISSPCLLTVRVCVAVSCDCSLVCFSISAICCRCCDGAEISIPRMMSRISDCVSDATFTLRGQCGSHKDPFPLGHVCLNGKNVTWVHGNPYYPRQSSSDTCKGSVKCRCTTICHTPGWPCAGALFSQAQICSASIHPIFSLIKSSLAQDNSQKQKP